MKLTTKEIKLISRKIFQEFKHIREEQLQKVEEIENKIKTHIRNSEVLNPYKKIISNESSKYIKQLKLNHEDVSKIYKTIRIRFGGKTYLLPSDEMWDKDQSYYNNYCPPTLDDIVNLFYYYINFNHAIDKILKEIFPLYSNNDYEAYIEDLITIENLKQKKDFDYDLLVESVLKQLEINGTGNIELE